MLGAFGWGSDGEDKGGAEEEEGGQEEEGQDFGTGIHSRQGLMLAVAFVMERVTAMCQLPLRVAVECFAQQSGCGESRL